MLVCISFRPHYTNEKTIIYSVPGWNQKKREKQKVIAFWAQQRTCFKVRAVRFEGFLSPQCMQSDSQKQVQQAHMKKAQHSSLYLDLRCLDFWSSTAQCLNLKNTRGKKWRGTSTLPHDQYMMKRRGKLFKLFNTWINCKMHCYNTETGLKLPFKKFYIYIK